jgi:hypothetical protein
MIPEKVLYTDGHHVTVTESVFMIKNTMYQLKGITNHGFQIIRPHRLPPLFVALVGALLIFLGVSHIVPKHFIPDFILQSIQLSVNTAAACLGAGLLVVGSVVFGLMKERYAIRISTAEGEKNVVVSRRREYIAQILDALNKAFMSLVSPKKESGKDKGRKPFQVSTR